MDNLGFVTISRAPTPKQEAAFEVEGIFELAQDVGGEFSAYGNIYECFVV
jgi:hypothetical protein